MPKGQVSYPKKRQRKEVFHVEGVQEPVRKTTYDVVLENFKIAKRGTYLHRIIYVGEHSFKKEQEQITDIFSKTITQVNEGYYLENLTGFLLIYNKYFVHLVEGSEASIRSHLELLLDNNKNKEHLGTCKLLIYVSHVRQRFINTWKYYHGTPSKLLTQIDINSNLEESGRIAYNCIKKIYNLVLTFEDDINETAEPSTREPTVIDEDSISRSSRFRSEMRTSYMSNLTLRTMQPIGLDPYRATLPEYDVLEFILQTEFTHDLRNYYELYGLVPQRLIYKDRVWPVPSDFIPYDIFSKQYDCIVELPKERKSEEKESAEADIVVEGEGENTAV